MVPNAQNRKKNMGRPSALNREKKKKNRKCKKFFGNFNEVGRIS